MALVEDWAQLLMPQERNCQVCGQREKAYHICTCLDTHQGAGTHTDGCSGNNHGIVLVDSHNKAHNYAHVFMCLVKLGVLCILGGCLALGAGRLLVFALLS